MTSKSTIKKSLLYNPTHCCQLNSTLSGKLSKGLFHVNQDEVIFKIFSLSSGVPRSTILGPLFVIIYTNDIGDNLPINNLLSVDDIKIYSVIE